MDLVPYDTAINTVLTNASGIDSSYADSILALVTNC